VKFYINIIINIYVILPNSFPVAKADGKLFFLSKTEKCCLCQTK
jgi:hypothetical protein